jgi:hypothetical protein
LPAAEVTLDIVEFGRLVGDRRDPARVPAEVTGDAALARESSPQHRRWPRCRYPIGGIAHRISHTGCGASLGWRSDPGEDRLVGRRSD